MGGFDGMSNNGRKMESHDETGCQAPEGSVLCINNCGFFGSAATMNMCSKCHKDLIMKREQSIKLTTTLPPPTSSSPNSSSGGGVAASSGIVGDPTALISGLQSGSDLRSVVVKSPESRSVSEGPNRCTACHKRVGLTGFGCRCGGIFCTLHRHSDKHGCPFDYRSIARDAIARANPVVKAEKLDKI